MSMNAAGVANVALAQIASQELQLQLADASVILPTIWDLSSKVGPGMKSIAIPRVSGLATAAMLDNGNEATGSGMTLSVDTLLLNNKRSLPEYIYDTSIDSAVDIEKAFFDNAPSVFLEYVENVVYLELDGASASNPDHVLQMSGVSNIIPTLADIRLAAKLLDEQKLPASDRFLAVTPNIKHAILAFTEVSDTSKFGNSEAIQKGYIGELYGFKIVCSNQVTANTMVAYHRSACAFGAQKKLTPAKERQESKYRTFIALNMMFGVKVLDAGKRCILFNATGS